MNKALMILLATALVASTFFLLTKGKKEVVNKDEVFEEFKIWKLKFNKEYASPQEDTYRFSVFLENYIMIKKHDPKVGYTLAINQFADLPAFEFKATYLTAKYQDLSNDGMLTLNEPLTAPPASVNWVEKGDVSPVKDQGQCGSCWAFSATGGMESADAIFGTGLGDFSEQQLVDCSPYPNQGCNGGNFFYAWNYVIANGIQTEQAYPYTGVQGKCQQKGGPFKIKSYTKVQQNSCLALQTAIAQQPTSIFVNAQTWQFYSSGIFSNCQASQEDHMVLAVGYQSNYWLVKNSWGVTWGQQGFIELAMGNTCGICYYTGYPNLN